MDESKPGAVAVSCVLLAAGMSLRAGANKLLWPWKGSTVVRRAARALLEADIREVVVVTGHEAERVRNALRGLRVKFAHNASFAQGMGGSISEGVRACAPDADGFWIALGDMPEVGPLDLRDQIVCFERAGPGAIVLPTFEGMDGHPVLFAHDYRRELESLSGDRGARSVINAHVERVVRVPAGPGCVFDVDTEHAVPRFETR